jgi:hypothetical protein
LSLYSLHVGDSHWDCQSNCKKYCTQRNTCCEPRFHIQATLQVVRAAYQISTCVCNAKFRQSMTSYDDSSEPPYLSSKSLPSFDGAPGLSKPTCVSLPPVDSNRKPHAHNKPHLLPMLYTPPQTPLIMQMLHHPTLICKICITVARHRSLTRSRPQGVRWQLLAATM